MDSFHLFLTLELSLIRIKIKYNLEKSCMFQNSLSLYLLWNSHILSIVLSFLFLLIFALYLFGSFLRTTLFIYLFFERAWWSILLSSHNNYHCIGNSTKFTWFITLTFGWFFYIYIYIYMYILRGFRKLVITFFSCQKYP